jgi:hypothetical protein
VKPAAFRDFHAGTRLARPSAGRERIVSDILKRTAALAVAASAFVLPVTAVLLIFAALLALRPREPWQP